MIGGSDGRTSQRRTKIVCTLGPSSSTPARIEALASAGMDCARLNFSHGTPEEHLRTLRHIRDVSKRTRNLLAVMQDLPGPKLRVGRLRGGSVRMTKGSKVVLTTDSGLSVDGEIPVESEDLPRYVKPGGRIFLCDGSIELRIISVTDSTIVCVCEIGGVVLSGKGVNIPDLKHGFKTFTQRDKSYLELGLEHDVDLVAVSFVRNASDVEAVRRFVDKRGAGALIVAKIEKREAVRNIAEIVEASDAVMVARGDLGVENPVEEVPEMQKSIIAHSRSKGVPVITATQMLESMVGNPSPTRAEVTDVANAILDGTDAVMLSEETAIGKYPVECVGVMNRVAIKAEERMLGNRSLRSLNDFHSENLADAFSASAWHLSEDIGARVIAVRTADETIIPKVSRFRPEAMIVHVSADENQLRRSRLIWGVRQSLQAEESRWMSRDSPVASLMKDGYLKKGDGVVFLHDNEASAGQARLSLSATIARPR